MTFALIENPSFCKWRSKRAEKGGEAGAVVKCGPFLQNLKETSFQGGGTKGVSRHGAMDPDPSTNPPGRKE